MTADTRIAYRLARRWYLTILGLILTLGLCYVATLVASATYQAQADVLLTPPIKTGGANPTNNPLLALGGAQPIADVVASAMTNSTTAEHLSALGFDGTYTILRDTSTDGPVLIVTTKGTSAAKALNGLGLVIDDISPTMVRLQDAESVSRDNQVTSQVITRSTKADRQVKRQIRAAVLAGAVGLFGTVLLVSLFDEWALRRKRREDLPPGQGGTSSGAVPDSALVSELPNPAPVEAADQPPTTTSRREGNTASPMGVAEPMLVAERPTPRNGAARSGSEHASASFLTSIPTGGTTAKDARLSTDGG